MIPSFLNAADCLFLAKEDHAKTGSAVLAVVDPQNLVTMAEGFLAAGYHLEDVSGLDVTEGAVSVYHFDHFDAPGRVTMLAIAPHDSPVFPSIASVYHGAEWHERETRDFYGYTYEGNPNFVPLLLSDDMVDVHPLVKEEGKRASLLTLFGGGGRTREVVKKAPSFTLLDAPVVSEVEDAPEQVAVPAEAPAAPVAETRKEPVTTPEAPEVSGAETKATAIDPIESGAAKLDEQKELPAAEASAKAQKADRPVAAKTKKDASVQSVKPANPAKKAAQKGAGSGNKGGRNA